MDAPFSEATEIEILVPLLKGQKDPITGARTIHGIASDEKRDADNEIVKASGKPSILDYLNGVACLNYDHGKQIVGRVKKAGFLSNNQAQMLYGQSFVGTPLRIEGEVHPILDWDKAPEDLKEVHRLMDSGHPLYFSIQGTCESRTRGADGVPVAIPGLISQVAITAMPKNTNAVAVYKSLSHVMDAWDTGDQPTVIGEDRKWQQRKGDPATEPLKDVSKERWIYKAPMPEVLTDALLLKGLESTGAVAQAGTSGGDALKVQDLSGGGNQAAPQSCVCVCGHKMNKGDKYCSRCGSLYKSLAALIGDFLSLS